MKSSQYEYYSHPKYYSIKNHHPRLKFVKYHKMLFKITTSFGIKNSFYGNQLPYIILRNGILTSSPMILSIYFPLPIPEGWMGDCIESQDEYLQFIL